MPILSVIAITFIDGVDICDLATPAGRIWQSVLKYLQTCPGCESLYWAISPEDPKVIELLIPWDSIESHKEFQDSLGVSLAAGFFEKPLEHHLMPITDAKLGGLGQLTYVQKFFFSATTRHDEKATFERGWERFACLQYENGSLNCQGQWLADGTKSNLPTKQPLSDAEPGLVFFGLTVFDELVESSVSRLHFERKFEEEAQKLKSLVPSRYTTEKILFNRVESVFSGSTMVGISAPPFSMLLQSPISLSSLLAISPPIQFTPQAQRGALGHYDASWSSRKDHSKEPGRDTGWDLGWPTPYGGYTSMRTLVGDKMSWHCARPNRYVTCYKEHGKAVDMVHFSFKPRGIIKWKETDVFWEREAMLSRHQSMDLEEDEDELEDVAEDPTFDGPLFLLENVSIWSAMRTKLLALAGCNMLFYGVCEENPNIIDLLICWKDSSYREEHCPRHKRLGEELFNSLESYLNCSPTTTYLPFLETPTTYTGADRVEIIKFFIPISFSAKDAFEHYYYDFIRTLSSAGNAKYVYTNAGRAWTEGWQQGTELRKGQTANVFVGFLFWHTKEAEETWYNDFYKGMMISYERLGHKVDALNAMIVDFESHHRIFRMHGEKDESENLMFLF